MKQIQYQAVFSVVPPAPKPVGGFFGAMDALPVKRAVAVAALAATFNLPANYKPPAPTFLPTGFQTYNNQPNFNRFVPPLDGQALYKPAAAAGAVFKAGSDSWTNQINFRPFVPAQDGQALFKPQPAPSGFQTWNNQINFKTVVGPLDQPAHYQPPAPYASYSGAGFSNFAVASQILHQSVFPVTTPQAAAAGAVFKAGSDTWANQINFRTVVRPEIGLALFKPAAAAASNTAYGYQSWDNLVINRTFVSPQDTHAEYQPSQTQTQMVAGFTSFAIEIPFIVVDPNPGTLFQPAAATPAVWHAGSDTYNNQINFQTIIRPELGPEWQRFASINPPASTTGFVSYDNLVVNRAIIRPELGQALFKPPPLPTGFQSWDNRVVFQAFVRPELQQVPLQPFVAPVFRAGSDTYNNQINFRTLVGPQDITAPYAAAVQTALPTGFQSWDIPLFNRTFVPAQDGQQLALFASIPPANPIPSGDGPPWHLTQKEIKRLLHYREELARIQQAYDARRRDAVDEVLRDVTAAAGLGQAEPEAVAKIEDKIRSLPQPKKGLFALDLKALKAQVDKNALARELEEDDHIAMMIIKAYFT